MTQETAPIVDRENDFDALWAAGNRIVEKNTANSYTANQGTYSDTYFAPENSPSHGIFTFYAGNVPNGYPSHSYEVDGVSDEGKAKKYYIHIYAHGTATDPEIRSNFIDLPEPEKYKKDSDHVIYVEQPDDKVYDRDGLQRLYGVLDTAESNIRMEQDLEPFPIGVEVYSDTPSQYLSSIIERLAVGDKKQIVHWNSDNHAYELQLRESVKNGKSLQLQRYLGTVNDGYLQYKQTEQWTFSGSNPQGAYEEIRTLDPVDIFQLSGLTRRGAKLAIEALSNSQVASLNDSNDVYLQRLQNGRDILLRSTKH